ncbi:unnamed protein product [Candidula unifasciata]|uniref:G-protein coupled receptors family 1 profile domain-containing protein n=1 Tax=Candidula unifasciata TaxID=100452 RepID=A0A8S3ZG73_9EUPU|nr:unnamed protein product [Candidula unifasciata]
MNESNSCNTSHHKHHCDCDLLTAFIAFKGHIGPPLLLFGIICNILAFFTLRQPKLKESPFIHLTGLTVSDLSALVLMFISLYETKYNKQWTYYICYIYYPLINTAALFCVWIMVIMTLERCIFMQFPLWAPIWCTNSSAKLKIVIVFLTCIVLSIPRFFLYKVISFKPHPCAYLNTSQKSVELFRVTGTIRGTILANVLAWFYSCIHNFLPVTILLVLNSFLIYKIRAQHKRRSQLGVHSILQLGRTHEQTRLTITLIAITGIYIVLVLPSAFSDTNISDILFDKKRAEQGLFQHVSIFLFWLDLSFNFLLYTFVNVKFMRAFKQMMSRWYSRIYGCVACCKLPQAHVKKTNSSTATYVDRRTKELPLRRHPGLQSGRPSCSSRLLTSRGLI